MEQKEFATSFNFGPEANGHLKVEEVLQIAKGFWHKISYEYKIDLDALHEANLLMLDTSKAKKMLSWRPILTSEEGIKMTIEWHKSFYNEKNVISIPQLDSFIKNII